MRILIKMLLAFALLVVSQRALAVHVDQQNVCQGASVPKGWVIVNKVWNRTTCGSPTIPQGNQWLIAEYDNLPVGTPLTICSFSSSIPSGWLPESFQTNKAVCGAQYGNNDPYDTVTIKYVLCKNEANSLCYPSLANYAVISALPTRVVIPYGQGTEPTEVGWFASVPVCIWVTTAGSGTQLWRCDGNYGVETWSSVGPGSTQTFIVSTSMTAPTPVLASVVVTGVEGTAPRINASPATVTVPAGQANGSTTISYNLAGSYYPAMCIWVSNDGGAAELWACGAGTTFSQSWPYVPKGGTSTFWLNPSPTSSTQKLATVVVTGK